MDTTADIFLKAFSGTIIFLILDGFYGEASHIFNHKIYPFFLTTNIYNAILKVSKSFGTSYTLLTIYLLFWAWGKLMYILRQPLFFDSLKQSYTLKIDKGKPEIENFENLRSEVVQKLSLELGNNWKNLIENNDYLLYQILGKIKKYLPASTRKRSSEADDIAFIGTNVIFVFLIVSIGYFFPIFNFGNIFLVVLPLLEIAISIITIFVLWKFFLSRARNRYISRNTRLYINYLLDTKSSRERLLESENKE